MAAFTTRGALTEDKERRRLQAKHLWMEVKLSWHVLADRMYTVAPTRKSREQLYALLFNKAARGSQKNPYKENAYRGPAQKEVQACIPGQGKDARAEVEILRKEGADKRGHLPAQATTTLA